MNEELIEGTVDERLEGADLCLCCLEPMRPGALMCRDCGAPQDCYAAVLPFLRVISEGFIYRRAVQEPRALISVLGIWFIFGPAALSSGLVVWMALQARWGLQGHAYYAGMFAYTLVSLMAVAKSTGNYFGYRKVGNLN